jgi:hypothetical protein
MFDAIIAGHNVEVGVMSGDSKQLDVNEAGFPVHQALLAFLREKLAPCGHDDCLAAECKPTAKTPGLIGELGQEFGQKYSLEELVCAVVCWPQVTRYQLAHQGHVGTIATLGVAVTVSAVLHHRDLGAAIAVMPEEDAPVMPLPPMHSPSLN